MRPPRLPPLDTSGYISCPIGTPLVDFDQKSPLPCIIVTPSSPTEYHIAFHHKSSPLVHTSFASQQQQKQLLQQGQARSRRAFLTALNPFVDTPPPISQSFETPGRRIFFKPRTRTALVLAIPLFIIICHILASSLLRSVGIGSSFFGDAMARGGFSSAASRLRAQREAQPQPVSLPIPAPSAIVPISPPNAVDEPGASQPLAGAGLD